MNTTFAESVRAAAVRPDVRESVRHLYQSLQSQIDARKPICQTSGRCCRFDEFGHRLYVTTAEMATFVHEMQITATPRASVRELISPGYSLPQLKGCPYQLDGLCSVHAIRPFGCRIFFCDASSTQWQHKQYELYHCELKTIHERLEIPYFYMEWRAALAEIS